MEKTHLTTRTALLALALLLCVALSVALLMPTVATAYTPTDTTFSSATQIGEIFDDDASTGGSFSKANLQTLLNALGTSGVSGNINIVDIFNDVDKSSTSIVTNQYYNDTMRIADKNIIVEFGGIKWIAAFLSLTDSGLVEDTDGANSIGNKPNAEDVVLTLWQAVGTESAQWNQYDITAQGNYPANMYGTSKIRAITLNNGGVYAISNTALHDNGSPVAQDKDNTYAKFTMSSYTKEPNGSNGAEKNSNISQYLVAPRYLLWQQNLKVPDIGWSDWTQNGKNQNNDAWGKQGQSEFESTYWYEELSGYDTWKDDLLWLPATAETGYGSHVGLWNTTQAQRQSNTNAWLRTAFNTNHFNRVYQLTTDGNNTYNIINMSQLVRPALHLNLTAAVASIGIDKPTGEDGSNSKTVVYNGQAQTFNLGLDSSLVSDDRVKVETTSLTGYGNAEVKDVGGKQVLSATNAGTYTVTVTPTEGNRWKNDENNDDTDPIEFTLTIEKRKVNINVAIPQGSPTTVPYGTAYTLLDVDKYWTYASGSLDFVNGDESNLTVSCDVATTGAYPTPDSYPLTVSYIGSKDNYDLTIDGSPTVTVTKADIILSGEFTTTYEYELDGNGSPVKRELKIAESQVTVVNGQKVTIKYGALTASTAGYDSSDDGYAVWKVGTYYVDVSITAPNHNTLTQRISVTITKAKPTVTPLCDRSEIWTSGVLPELTCTATLRNNQSVNGAISWITSLGTVRSDGYYDFYYRWVPEDQENFEIVDGDECYVRLYVRFASVTRFTVTFDPEGELFYETDSLNILKNYLTVTVTFSDGTTRVLGMNEYDLNCQGGTTLVAGDSVTVTVSYLSAGTPVERNFNVQVLAVERPPEETPPTGDNPDPAPKDPTGDTISKAKEFFENTPLPLGYAALVLGGMLLLIIILAIAGRKPKKKD